MQLSLVGITDMQLKCVLVKVCVLKIHTYQKMHT